MADDDRAARFDPGLARATLRWPAANPFNPGFGTAPPRFAGRQVLVAEILDRIERGPGRYDYHTVIVGPRGVGKTVLLGEVERGAMQRRWAVIHWNGSRPLLQAVSEQRPVLRGQLQGMLRRGLRRLEGGMDLKAAPGGVGAEARIGVVRDRDAPTSAYGMLEELGRIAAVRHGVIVIAADELQAASQTDLKEVAAAVQQLTNVQRLPVSLVAVGLPSTRHVLRSADVSPGFTERLEPIKISNLNAGATRDALETPFLDAGRGIEPDAVDRLVEASHGYPYGIQVVGHACWQAAGDADVVTTEHADVACDRLIETLDRQIYAGRWQTMSPGDRHYLYVAAQLCDHREVVSTGAIAAALNREPSNVTRNRDRLINQHHVLQPYGRGEVQFSVPGFAGWIRNYVEQMKAAGRDTGLQLSPGPGRQLDPGRER